jgi:hypothetical protein
MYIYIYYIIYICMCICICVCVCKRYTSDDMLYFNLVLTFDDGFITIYRISRVFNHIFICQCIYVSKIHGVS